MDEQNLIIPNIQMMMLYAGTIDLNILKDLKEKLQADFARYEALGIVDGHAYYKKVDTKRALLQRMEAVYNLAKVVQETKDLIDMEAIEPAKQ